MTYSFFVNHELARLREGFEESLWREVPKQEFKMPIVDDILRHNAFSPFSNEDELEWIPDSI